MTDNSFPENLNPVPNDRESIKASDSVEAVFIGPPRQITGDRYDLGGLFLCWWWGSGDRQWNTGVRALARALRGVDEAGLIERRTIRRASGATHHGFVLTEDGHEALRALSGAWISDAVVERGA